MKEYRKFKLPGNATLRVASNKIVATVSSKDSGNISLYVEGIVNPFHLPITEEHDAHEIIDYIWDRNTEVD